MHDRPTVDNPFCTRQVRPGAIPFIFPPDQSAETLVARLRQANWWGQIVGPHGSGKSTLLAALAAAIRNAGRRVFLVELHDAERRLPRTLWSEIAAGPDLLLVIDGYEQLSYWSRLALKRDCRRYGTGLLVTSHKSVGFPDLYQTLVTPALAQQVVTELLGDRQPLFAPDEVSQSVSRHDGDLRETLFDLYDIYEQRRPAQGENVT
jgi:energy-coupling factor transporter ATP-binding protein EcfA2